MEYTRENIENMSDYEKRKLAENNGTSSSVLEILAGDGDTGIRWHVAENPNTPVSVLEILAGDENNWVRGQVANNPNSSVKVLLRVFETEKLEKTKGVLEALRKNPKSPAWMKAAIETMLESL